MLIEKNDLIEVATFLFKELGLRFIIASGIVDSVARLPRDLRDMSIVLAEMQRVFELLLRGMAAPGVDRSQLSLSEN